VVFRGEHGSLLDHECKICVSFACLELNEEQIVSFFKKFNNYKVDIFKL